jgi:pyridoxine 5-phosphate synthase
MDKKTSKDMFNQSGKRCNLSVNINKIATLRNARGDGRPNLLEMALLIEQLGADGITVHPRPDERHIKRQDVLDLKRHLACELNIEGYPSERFIELIEEVRPAQVTLVPDKPDVLTSNQGFKLDDDFFLVEQSVKRIKIAGSRVSIFIDPKDFINRDILVIKNTGTDRIELYTKTWAQNFTDQTVVNLYQDVALHVRDEGLGINAGHDLDLHNLDPLLKAIPFIEEVSIGHALISDALIFGLPEVIKQYRKIVH